MKWGWVAAPAGVPRKHALGRPWVAVRPHYGGLPERAGRGTDEGGRKPAGSGRAKSRPGPRPEATAPGTEIAAISPDCASSVRVERREAPAFSKESAAQKDNGCAARRSIPLAFEGGRERRLPPGGAGTTAYPGPLKNTGGEAWPLCKHPPNNDNARRQRQGTSCPTSSAPPAACNMPRATRSELPPAQCSSARRSGNTCRRAGRAGPRSRRWRRAT